MFITLIRYLHDSIGFTDEEAGWVAGLFAAILYLLPTFMGILADKIGFRRALMIAFALLTGGYWLLGAFQLKSTAIASLVLIMFGGAIVKPVISGTAAKSSDDSNRARAMSIFYMVVNIGSFTGKSLAGDLNDRLGLEYINYYAAGMAFAAFLLVALFYRNIDTKGTGKTVEEALRGLLKVVRNFRFICLILIVAGFWAIQGQLYASMPTYMERLLGKVTKPEWLANINPLVVVLLVVPITHAVRKVKPENAIGVGLLIIPFTALVIALASAVESVTGPSIDLGLIALHPLTLMIAIGIGFQGLAECFLSPKFLEYASKQAPEGEVGLYLGFQHLHTFFAWLFGFVLSGYLLDAYCPAPKTLPPETRNQWRLATDPEYRFALPLDAEMRAELEAGGAVPESLRDTFATHGVRLGESATVSPEDSRDVWRITDDSGVYRLEEFELEPRDSDVDVVVIPGRVRPVQPADTQECFELVVSGDEPRPDAERPPLPKEYDHAHYLWLAFTGVGLAAFFGLVVFKFVTNAIDRKRAAETA
jgi:dipeptide/tripeptide permease